MHRKAVAQCFQNTFGLTKAFRDRKFLKKLLEFVKVIFKNKFVSACLLSMPATHRKK